MLEGVQMLLRVLNFAGADGIGDRPDGRLKVRKDPAHLQLVIFHDFRVAAGEAKANIGPFGGLAEGEAGVSCARFRGSLAIGERRGPRGGCFEGGEPEGEMVDAASLHFAADQDMLDDVAGVDGETGQGAGLKDGGGVAFGAEPRVAEFVGDEGILVGPPFGSAGAIKEDEVGLAIGTLVVDENPAHEDELADEVLLTEVLSEEGAGGCGIGEGHLPAIGGKPDFGDVDRGAAGGFDLSAPLLEGRRERKGQEREPEGHDLHCPTVGKVGREPPPRRVSMRA